MTPREISRVMDVEMAGSERCGPQHPVNDPMREEQVPPVAVSRGGQKWQFRVMCCGPGEMAG